MKQSKIVWIVATYPHSNPEQVKQLGVHRTKKAAMQHVGRLTEYRDHVVCVMKAEIVETVQ